MMKGRILIVEDDKDLCDELKDVLSGEGLEAEFAYSGNRGLEMAANGDFDLVILDLKLPGEDGFEVLRAIRGRDLPVPVLVVTGRPMTGKLNDDDDESQAREIANLADGVISKPFDVIQLLSRVRDLLP
jgi:DNA-binding response OmpR family regulator